MNPLDRLSEYLRSIEKRLRVLTWTRGAAIAAGAALISTVVLVMIANSYAFSSSSLLASRTALFLALALALGAGLLVPLLRLNRRRPARQSHGAQEVRSAHHRAVDRIHLHARQAVRQVCQRRQMGRGGHAPAARRPQS